MRQAFYQWSPLKDVCLAQCQSPIGFLMRYGGFRGDLPGCLLMGLRHGAYCIGCCWVLMALLFVGGVMNVLLIALLAVLVQSWPRSDDGSRAPPALLASPRVPGCCSSGKRLVFVAERPEVARTDLSPTLVYTSGVKGKPDIAETRRNRPY